MSRLHWVTHVFGGTAALYFAVALFRIYTDQPGDALASAGWGVAWAFMAAYAERSHRREQRKDSTNTTPTQR